MNARYAPRLHLAAWRPRIAGRLARWLLGSFTMSALCQLDVCLRLSPQLVERAHNLALVTAICRCSQQSATYHLRPPSPTSYSPVDSLRNGQRIASLIAGMQQSCDLFNQLIDVWPPCVKHWLALMDAPVLGLTANSCQVLWPRCVLVSPVAHNSIQLSTFPLIFVRNDWWP